MIDLQFENILKSVFSPIPRITRYSTYASWSAAAQTRTMARPRAIKKGEGQVYKEWQREAIQVLDSKERRIWSPINEWLQAYDKTAL